MWKLVSLLTCLWRKVIVLVAYNKAERTYPTIAFLIFHKLQTRPECECVDFVIIWDVAAKIFKFLNNVQCYTVNDYCWLCVVFSVSVICMDSLDVVFCRLSCSPKAWLISENLEDISCIVSSERRSLIDSIRTVVAAFRRKRLNSLPSLRVLIIINTFLLCLRQQI